MDFNYSGTKQPHQIIVRVEWVTGQYVGAMQGSQSVHVSIALIQR